MSTPKIASMFALLGAFGVIVAVLMGTSQKADYLLDASFFCLALSGLIMLLHVLIKLRADFTQSSDLHRHQP